jgi:hypothetical protein
VERTDFRDGERLWLQGRGVTFLGYHCYAGGRHIAAAFVRQDGESRVRVVTAAKLGRSRAESLLARADLDRSA